MQFNLALTCRVILAKSISTVPFRAVSLPNPGQLQIGPVLFLVRSASPRRLHFLTQTKPIQTNPNPKLSSRLRRLRLALAPPHLLSSFASIPYLVLFLYTIIPPTLPSLSKLLSSHSLSTPFLLLLPALQFSFKSSDSPLHYPLPNTGPHQKTVLRPPGISRRWCRILQPGFGRVTPVVLV